MVLKPQFLAPDYMGSAKLKGQVAIITGGDSGIGRAVAVLYAREGADVAIIYLNERDDAEETRRHVEAEGKQCLLLSGDVRDFIPVFAVTLPNRLMLTSDGLIRLKTPHEVFMKQLHFRHNAVALQT